MENHNENSERNVRSFKKAEDKPFFGVYINQARLNAYIVLCHISELLGLSVTEEDGLASMPLLRILGGEGDIIIRERAFNLTEEYFPMLKSIYNTSGKDKKEHRLETRSKIYERILRLFFKAINKKRNEYCHHVSGGDGLSVEDERRLCIYLDKSFDAAVNQVKKVRELDESEVSHLRRKISDRSGGKSKSKDNPDFHYKFYIDSEMTQKGLMYLVTLFLERRNAFLFLKKEIGFKRGETKSEKATLESFCALRVRVPKPVIKSDEDEKGLALDMLNELKKCPRELLSLLDKKVQEDFRQENDEGEEVLQMRYSDRFAYFTLRYCDERNVFEKLRFQIDLGKYYYKFYDKNAIDGNCFDRHLFRRLKTFGRLGDVKEEAMKQWGDITKRTNEPEERNGEPFKAESVPHYHITDNNIKFTLSGDVGLPQLESGSGTKRAEYEGWMSVYELPAMVFYGLECGFDKVERELEIFTGKRIKMLESAAVSEETSDEMRGLLKLSDGNGEDIDYRKNKLERLIKEAKQNIKKLKNELKRNEDIKPGKKKFADIKAGQLADKLARDMVAMQAFDPEKKGKDKITSLNFQVLQSSLAFYGAKKNELSGIFTRGGLMGGINQHPFLACLRPGGFHSIVDFYIAYYTEKINYLEQCKTSGNLSGLQFLRPKRPANSTKKRCIKEAAEELKDKPVNIPRGFFSDKIRELVCGEIAELKGREMNCAYMIGQYFERCLHDKSQKFYEFDRKYPIVQKAENYKNKEKDNQRYVPVLSGGMALKEIREKVKGIPGNVKFRQDNLRDNLLKMVKDMKKNENVLRLRKVQDMVMMMMVKDIIESGLAGDGEIGLRLCDIVPKAESSFQRPVECRIVVEAVFNRNQKHDDEYIEYIIKAENGIEYQEINNGKRVAVKFAIRMSETKLKDIGKYRRYLYDRRLPGLLLWKKAREIDVSEIETEISSYENLRVEMAQRLSELEKIALEGREKTEKHVPFSEVIDILKERMPDFVQKGDILLAIRNKLYHNQFPAYCEQIDTSEGGTIAEKIKNVVEEYVGDIVN